MYICKASVEAEAPQSKQYCKKVKASQVTRYSGALWSRKLSEAC